MPSYADGLCGTGQQVISQVKFTHCAYWHYELRRAIRCILPGRCPHQCSFWGSAWCCGVTKSSSGTALQMYAPTDGLPSQVTLYRATPRLIDTCTGPQPRQRHSERLNKHMLLQWRKCWLASQHATEMGVFVVSGLSELRAEGRIEPSDGTLMCSYHGWRFQGDGRCTHIPQASAAACSNPSSCASTRPTQVVLSVAP